MKWRKKKDFDYEVSFKWFALWPVYVGNDEYMWWEWVWRTHEYHGKGYWWELLLPLCIRHESGVYDLASGKNVIHEMKPQWTGIDK
jgi:hypothetical protein